jgi:hypothetical protein
MLNYISAFFSEPALYRIVTFYVPNLMSIFHCLRRVKGPSKFEVPRGILKRGAFLRGALTFHIAFKLEGGSLLPICNCLAYDIGVSEHWTGAWETFRVLTVKWRSC